MITINFLEPGEMRRVSIIFDPNDVRGKYVQFNLDADCWDAWDNTIHPVKSSSFEYLDEAVEFLIFEEVKE